jgi:hypothetical protein
MDNAKTNVKLDLMPMTLPTLVTNVMKHANHVHVKDQNAVYLVMVNSILKTTTVNQNVKNQEFMKMMMKTNVNTVTQLVLNVHVLLQTVVNLVKIHTTTTKTLALTPAQLVIMPMMLLELVNHATVLVPLAMENHKPHVLLVMHHSSYGKENVSKNVSIDITETLIQENVMNVTQLIVNNVPDQLKMIVPNVNHHTSLIPMTAIVISHALMENTETLTQELVTNAQMITVKLVKT